LRLGYVKLAQKKLKS